MHIRKVKITKIFLYTYSITCQFSVFFISYHSCTVLSVLSVTTTSGVVFHFRKWSWVCSHFGTFSILMWLQATLKVCSLLKSMATLSQWQKPSIVTGLHCLFTILLLLTLLLQIIYYYASSICSWRHTFATSSHSFILLNTGTSGMSLAALQHVHTFVLTFFLCYSSFSQNHRIVGLRRDLCGSASPTPLPKQGHLQQAAQDLVQAGLEYLQRRRLHTQRDLGVERLGWHPGERAEGTAELWHGLGLSYKAIEYCQFLAP